MHFGKRDKLLQLSVSVARCFKRSHFGTVACSTVKYCVEFYEENSIHHRRGKKIKRSTPCVCFSSCVHGPPRHALMNLPFIILLGHGMSPHCAMLCRQVALFLPRKKKNSDDRRRFAQQRPRAHVCVMYMVYHLQRVAFIYPSRTLKYPFKYFDVATSYLSSSLLHLVGCQK